MFQGPGLFPIQNATMEEDDPCFEIVTTSQTSFETIFEIVKPSSKRGIGLIPWRHPFKGPILRDSLFELALERKIYLIPKGMNSGAQWDQFVVALRNLPAFKEYVAISTVFNMRKIKDYFHKLLDERAQLFGWTSKGNETLIHLERLKHMSQQK